MPRREVRRSGIIALWAVILILPVVAAAGTSFAHPLPPRPIPSEIAGANATISPWTNLTTSGASPPAGTGDAMVNDSYDGYTVWFGGQGPGGIGLTWLWAGGSWWNVTSTLPASPPARSFASFVYDAASREAILFGGLGDPTYLNDTWSWSGGYWTNRSATAGPAPSPRAEAAATYDPDIAGVLLYGGVGTTVLGDTWSFTGTHWSRLLPVHSPPPVCCGAMAYDGVADQPVLVAGNSTTSEFLTWAFTDGDWVNQTHGASPSIRYWPTLVSDPDVGGLLLFGGSSVAAPPYWPLGDAWLYEGGNWTAAASATTGTASPSPRWGAAAAPVLVGPENQSCLLLVGGGSTNGVALANDTVWEGCGNRTAWTTGTTPINPGAAPPVVLLGATRTRGIVPYVAPITLTVRNGTPPFSVQICTSTSGCYSQEGWNGSTPMQDAINVTSAGTVAVTALVIDSQNLSGSSALSLVGIAPGPLAVVPSEGPTRGGPPLTVTFRAAVTGGVPPYEVQWTFGDGTAAPGAPNATITHPYGSAGSYFPSLEVTDADGQSTNVSLTPVVVQPVGTVSNQTPGLPPLTSLVAPAIILAAGVMAAAAVYALRRRQTLQEADATMDEVRGGRGDGSPEGPGEPPGPGPT